VSETIDARADVTTGLASPNLRTTRFEDYGAIRKLASEHSIPFPPVQDWEHRWRRNPVWQRLGGRSPIGWVLETDTGEIVGSMETVPTLYKFRGSDLVSAASGLWCVSAPYRGFALQLISEYFNQSADLFISTTVGRTAVDTLRQLYDPVPIGQWDTTSCFVAHRRSFAQRALRKHRVPLAELLSYPAGAALWLVQAMREEPSPDPPRDVDIDMVTEFDPRFDAFWNELVRQNPEKLLAERSSLVLSWHFAEAIRTRRLWIFTASKRQKLIGYSIFKEVASTHGARNASLIDYQRLDDEVELLPSFSRAALRRCTAEGLYRLDHVGVGLPKFRAFDELAHYKRSLGTWTFLFRAADAQLDAELHQPQFWDPSAYDGDASL
jgi:hypothetical protein